MNIQTLYNIGNTITFTHKARHAEPVTLTKKIHSIQLDVGYDSKLHIIYKVWHNMGLLYVREEEVICSTTGFKDPNTLRAKLEELGVSVEELHDFGPRGNSNITHEDDEDNPFGLDAETRDSIKGITLESEGFYTKEVSPNTGMAELLIDQIGSIIKRYSAANTSHLAIKQMSSNGKIKLSERPSTSGMELVYNNGKVIVDDSIDTIKNRVENVQRCTRHSCHSSKDSVCLASPWYYKQCKNKMSLED